ncbi:hypothetical protein SAMD00019534_033260 [Acytostelium subglobosum LB1]|uniref:hypothetical protein n=1 Tax=Acytostelium subglobosum LB1 TaxID=1410327 RepID=UPI0006450376|nr:hypothetical protein SAMD00019534_033260 [Acytostelium subglobosum LB1]GAM20151.1 hypothetical protein SAMD00019534_033260 [Acytostelium subglobosum LB1]|eukprot:XP_012759672.1 hypothetical protein SAMD00019534_033260 [Acytostelium subglobosum LB1]
MASTGSPGSGSGSGSAGSLSPSSSMHNFNMLYDVNFQGVNDMFGATHRGSSGGTIGFLAADNTPNYDVELIVQTTKQEDARFMGKKKRRCSSVSKVFLGDFLSLSKNITILKMISRYGDNQILFSDVLIKVNKRNKMQERIIIITDKALYNVQPDDYKLKRRISISSFSALSMSTLEDNFIVIHVHSEYDYVLISGRKIEIATVLVEAFYKQSILQQQFPPHLFQVAPPRELAGSAMNSNSTTSSSSSAAATGGGNINNTGGSVGGTPINASTPIGGLSPNLQSSLAAPTSIPQQTTSLLTSSSTATSLASSGIINGNSNNNNNAALIPSPLGMTVTSSTSSSTKPTTLQQQPVNNNNVQQQQQHPHSVHDHMLPVIFTERIEYKIEGDSMREILFTRVQGAVNVQIQTARSGNRAAMQKKEASRNSVR